MRHWAGWLIVKDKRILLIKRSQNAWSFPECWGIPWGRWEAGETPEDTAVREVKEEVGLDFIPTRLILKSTIENWWEKIHGHRYLWVFSWEIKLQEEECDGYGWFNYDEINELKIAFDYKDAIEELRKEDLL